MDGVVVLERVELADDVEKEAETVGGGDFQGGDDEGVEADEGGDAGNAVETGLRLEKGLQVEIDELAEVIGGLLLEHHEEVRYGGIAHLAERAGMLAELDAGDGEGLSDVLEERAGAVGEDGLPLGLLLLAVDRHEFVLLVVHDEFVPLLVDGEVAVVVAAVASLVGILAGALVGHGDEGGRMDAGDVDGEVHAGHYPVLLHVYPEIRAERLEMLGVAVPEQTGELDLGVLVAVLLPGGRIDDLDGSDHVVRSVGEVDDADGALSENVVKFREEGGEGDGIFAFRPEGGKGKEVRTAGREFHREPVDILIVGGEPEGIDEGGRGGYLRGGAEVFVFHSESFSW